MSSGEWATEAFLRAAREVLAAPDPPAILALRAALERWRSELASLRPRHEGCAVCGDAPDTGYSFSKGSEQASLPAACYAVIPLDLMRADRCREVLRCPACGAGYVYERDYEFLVGGTEDEETFTRLHLPSLLDAIERRLPYIEKYRDVSDLRDDLRMVEEALALG